MYHGQAEQDKFILNVLKNKQSGYFVEIGSNHPIKTNNTYLLESRYNWKGIMVEYNPAYLPLYKQCRPNSIHIINDATLIDYNNLFKVNNVPLSIDYLQIDLDANNGSTLQTLQILDKTIFDEYKFATVTFEHDIWNTGNTNFNHTREKSREILNKRGYVCVFEDIHNVEPRFVYEDWYVHPDLVDMEYVSKLKERNRKYYGENPITGKSLNWQDIYY